MNTQLNRLIACDDVFCRMVQWILGHGSVGLYYLFHFAAGSSQCIAFMSFSGNP